MAKVEVERDGPVWVLRINRPDVRNCIDGETAGLLEEAIDAFAGDAEAAALVVTGAGDEAFCTGADLKAAGSVLGRPGRARSSPLGFARLDPGKPTIAAVEGWCVAGGLELATWCDWRVAGDGARFGVFNRRWGIPLIDGGTQRLPRIVGESNALYLIETGAEIDAARALQMGLVQDVVPAGQALERAIALARRLLEYPRASLLADRASAIAALGTELGAGLEAEAERGEAAVHDPEIAPALERFASGERPEPPRG